MNRVRSWLVLIFVAISLLPGTADAAGFKRTRLVPGGGDSGPVGQNPGQPQLKAKVISTPAVQQIPGQ